MSLNQPPDSPAGLAGHPAVALEPTLDSANAGAQVAEDVSVTQRLGRFVLLRHLGTGGMGSVFAAYDEQLDRKVALKLLNQFATTQGEQRLRVLREAQAMARVSHPNVVHVYDVGEICGRIFIAMEFIDGGTLTSWQKSQGRSWQQILHLYRQAGAGLLAAHENGLVHRDFKPDNILVDRDGRVRVADFGLARLHTKAAVASSEQAGHLMGSGLSQEPQTEAGSICGTPGYMSPEQYRGASVDSRSDQFSFCVALYEALFHRLPFAGETMAEQAANVIAGQLLPPDDQLIPPATRSALIRGLSVDPEARFPTMAELLNALAEDEESSPAAARSMRRRLTVMLLVVSAILAVIGLFKYRSGGTTASKTVDIAALGFLLTAGVAVVFRRALRIHAFHRGVVILLLLAHATWFGVRCLSAVLHLELAQLIPIDLMVMGGLYSTIAYQYLPRLGWWSCIAVLGAILSAFFPRHAQLIGNIAYIPIALIFFIAWERAAREHKRQKKTAT